MRYKKGDYVIFRLYYKDIQARMMLWRETLAYIHHIERSMRGMYCMTVHGKPGTVWAGDDSIIRAASALEVLAYES